MNKSAVFRGAGLFIAAAGSLLFGFSAAASASPVLFQASNATVKVTGDDATALNLCLQDAQDGIIQQQAQACDQSATAGNFVTLENVAIYVTSRPSYVNLHASSVKVSGGIVTAINECIQDAQDGIIQQQSQACHQYANAGNIVTLSGVSVVVS